MASSEIFVKQTIFKAHHPPFSVISCHESQLPIQLSSFLLSVNGVVGLSADYGANCRMTSLAIASATKVLVVTFSNPKGRSEATTGNISHRGLLKSLLADVGSLKVALRMDQISTALYSDHQLHIRGGKDLLSLSKASRDYIEGVMNALGGEATLCKPAVITAFLRGQKEIAMKAWAVCRAAVVPHVLVKLAKSPSIDTIDFDTKVHFCDLLVFMTKHKVKLGADSNLKVHSRRRSPCCTETRSRQKRYHQRDQGSQRWQPGGHLSEVQDTSYVYFSKPGQ